MNRKMDVCMWSSIKGEAMFLMAAVLLPGTSCQSRMPRGVAPQDSDSVTAPEIVSPVTVEESGDTAIFYYDAEGLQAEAKEHWEDEVIMIGRQRGKLYGIFWATSDEFIPAREGYLPGFTVLRMQDVMLRGDTLSFLLGSKGQRFFSAPVDVQVRSVREAVSLGYHEWAQRANMIADTIRYQGLLRGDTLLLGETRNRWPRTFIRKSEEEVRGICRDMDADLELQNRREYWEQRSDSI